MCGRARKSFFARFALPVDAASRAPCIARSHMLFKQKVWLCISSEMPARMYIETLHYAGTHVQVNCLPDENHRKFTLSQLSKPPCNQKLLVTDASGTEAWYENKSGGQFGRIQKQDFPCRLRVQTTTAGATPTRS